MIELTDLSLNDITPSSIVHDPEISSLITAIDPELKELSQATLEALIGQRINELPEPVIDLLAWQMHVDFFDSIPALSMKREAVKRSILWHMHKGTEYAIIEALRWIDIKAEFVHWHDFGGDPYTFKLTAIVAGDFYRTTGKDKLISTIRRVVEESKSARSLMTELETRMEFREDIGLYVGSPILLSGNRRLMLDKPSPPEKTVNYFGLSLGLQGHRKILLNREREIISSLYAANITITNIDQNIGVNLELMQELLLRFEKRILDRIDSYETRLMAVLTQNQIETNRRLDDILELIRWKGDDEAV